MPPPDRLVQLVDSSGDEVSSLGGDTELPAAAALDDAAANPTAPAVGAFNMVWNAAGTNWRRQPTANNVADANAGGALPTVAGMVYNGTTWDRTRGDATNGTLVNLGANNDVAVATVPVVGTHANAWDAASTGVGGTSTAVDCQYVSQVAVFGDTSGASTLTVQLSQDNSNFYDSETTISADGDFGTTVSVGARYVRLHSSADVTATATIAGKA